MLDTHIEHLGVAVDPYGLNPSIGNEPAATSRGPAPIFATGADTALWIAAVASVSDVVSVRTSHFAQLYTKRIELIATSWTSAETLRR